MVAPFVPFIYWNHNNDQDNISIPQDYFLPISQDLFDVALGMAKKVTGLDPIYCVKFFRDEFEFDSIIESSNIEDHYAIKFLFEEGVEYRVWTTPLYHLSCIS